MVIASERPVVNSWGSWRYPKNTSRRASLRPLAGSDIPQDCTHRNISSSKQIWHVFPLQTPALWFSAIRIIGVQSSCQCFNTSSSKTLNTISVEHFQLNSEQQSMTEPQFSHLTTWSSYSFRLKLPCTPDVSHSDMSLLLLQPSGDHTCPEWQGHVPGSPSAWREDNTLCYSASLGACPNQQSMRYYWFWKQPETALAISLMHTL